eukprot:TRINITY_DN68903_c0_g1_i1.p1 TRINITY_DN68903_c0_g1~~TRINITY_DN68903_c0_g1_i1.p1  ORF type:complete len:537 (-),score=25.89 TRINITY_DN68903_c0_g1_i1:24-1634(-)
MTMQKVTFDDEKAKGNKAFKAKEYAVALEHYNRAAELDPTNAAVFNNLALTCNKLKQYPKSAMFAAKCVALKPDWVKGWFSLGTALFAEHKLAAADAALHKALALDDNPDVKGRLQDVVWRRGFQMLDKTKLEIFKTPNGKGLQAREDIKAGEVLYKDVPVLASQRIPTKYTCHHCIKWIGQTTDAPGDYLFPNPITQQIPTATPFPCHHCSRVVYCSDKCRTEAWQQYHCALCTKDDIKHAAHKLEIYLNEDNTKLASTAYLTSKMVAMLATGFLSLGKQESRVVTNKTMFDMSFETCMEPFRRLYHPPVDKCLLFDWATPAYNLTKQAILTNMEQLRDGKGKNENGEWTEIAQAKQILSYQRYCLLMYMQKMNAQAICGDCPLTADEWQHVLRPNLATTTKWLNLLDAPHEPLVLLYGKAFFQVQSCLNHSCEPNIDCCYSEADRNITITAVKDIKAGEQLFHTYVDTTLDVLERRARLVNWGFECCCPKCEREMTPEKLEKWEKCTDKQVFQNFTSTMHDKAEKNPKNAFCGV